MNQEEVIKRAIDKLSENTYDDNENELNRQSIIILSKMIMTENDIIYKVKSKREAEYEKNKILMHLYSLEDELNYTDNKITKFIDFLQDVKFEVEE